jgi:hypothetical protein
MPQYIFNSLHIVLLFLRSYLLSPVTTLSTLYANFRLDFDQFNIAGPEPVDHMCNSDQFIVAGGNPAPAICGINNGNHSEYTATLLRVSRTWVMWHKQRRRAMLETINTFHELYKHLCHCLSVKQRSIEFVNAIYEIVCKFSSNKYIVTCTSNYTGCLIVNWIY